MTMCMTLPVKDYDYEGSGPEMQEGMWKTLQAEGPGRKSKIMGVARVILFLVSFHKSFPRNERGEKASRLPC